MSAWLVALLWAVGGLVLLVVLFIVWLLWMLKGLPDVIEP